MARMTARIGMGTLGLLAGLGAPRLAAQAWALPASDPVGIARSGAGVAYGASLEATALNPALLATLREDRSAYLAVGLEMQVSKATLQANQQVAYSSDRNRFLPALGAAWRIDPTLVLGLKLDEPFLRHAIMPGASTGPVPVGEGPAAGYTGRFMGQAMDLDTHRLEAQLGWAATPNWAFGASLGVTRIQYSWDNMVRTVVDNATPGAGNAPMGLMESDLHEEGAKLAPSYSLGFRWAPNSRWTLGGSYVGAIKTTLPLSASYGPASPGYYALDGYGPAPVGTSTQVQSASVVRPGSGAITLPGKVTLGVRQRVNQLFTYELDLRYMLGAQTVLPGMPSVSSAGGTVTGPGVSTAFRGGLGMNLMGELNLTKFLVLRLGASLDPAQRADNDVEPLTGGAKAAGFSGGLGIKTWGGELDLGYQFRQAQTIDTPNLDGQWRSSGYSTVPQNTTRVEGMGHLFSIGYKRAF